MENCASTSFIVGPGPSNMVLPRDEYLGPWAYYSLSVYIMLMKWKLCQLLNPSQEKKENYTSLRDKWSNPLEEDVRTQMIWMHDESSFSFDWWWQIIDKLINASFTLIASKYLSLSFDCTNHFLCKNLWLAIVLWKSFLVETLDWPFFLRHNFVSKTLHWPFFFIKNILSRTCVVPLKNMGQSR